MYINVPKVDKTLTSTITQLYRERGYDFKQISELLDISVPTLTRRNQNPTYEVLKEEPKTYPFLTINLEPEAASISNPISPYFAKPPEEFFTKYEREIQQRSNSYHCWAPSLQEQELLSWWRPNYNNMTQLFFWAYYHYIFRLGTEICDSFEDLLSIVWCRAWVRGISSKEQFKNWRELRCGYDDGPRDIMFGMPFSMIVEHYNAATVEKIAEAYKKAFDVEEWRDGEPFPPLKSSAAPVVFIDGVRPQLRPSE